MLGVASYFPYGFADIAPEERQQHFGSSLWMSDSELLEDCCPLGCHKAYDRVIEAYIFLSENSGTIWSDKSSDDIEEDSSELE